MRDSSGSRTQVFVDPPGYSVRRAEANARKALKESSKMPAFLDGGDPGTIFLIMLEGGEPNA
jgi:hypothetical protein